ncbi:hypothetical protein PMAYCL1PPCAC_32799, partial [Pristionchus mayeri]
VVRSCLLMISVFITITTIPMYALVVIFIIGEQYQCRFERTFYAIVKVGGISDIISLFGNLIYILSLLNFIHLPYTGICSQVLNGIKWSSRASTNLTDFLISFHRVSAMMLPLTHKFVVFQK